MPMQITIFDIEEKPLSNHPVELLREGEVISRATTDQNGVARFDTNFSSAPGLAIRSQQAEGDLRY